MTPETLWRITRAPFADLSGEGARRFGGRWNAVGVALVYASTSLALAALEALVHTDLDLVPDDLVAMRIAVPPVSAEIHTDATLPLGWREEIGSAHTQAFGAAWATERRSALLLLPSVLLPGRAAVPEVNVIMNPLHPESDGIRIVERIPFTSSLSYDAATDSYTYVWKTERSWANSCRELTLKLSDGSEHRLRFRFTR